MFIRIFLSSCCNSRGVNSTHHCHYNMASADSKFDDFFCGVFNLNYKNVNELSASEFSGFTYTRSLTMNSKFPMWQTWPRAVLRFLVHC